MPESNWMALPRKSSVCITCTVFFLFPAWGLNPGTNAAAQPEGKAVVVSVDAGQSEGPLNHIWNGVMGDLSLTLTPRGERLLQRIAGSSPLPYYRRTMGVLNSGIGFPSSSNIYHETGDGAPFYDFTLFDQLFDAIQRTGMVPFVCLSFMPEVLSAAPDSGRKAWEYADRYPPKDYDKWYGFIRALAGHAVERYGREKVSGWKWEMWNEPDLRFFWHGTHEEYYKLYDYTAGAIRSVLPNARIGGNAVAGPASTGGGEFLLGFIKHCLSGRNYKTGSRGAPLDFITFHLKGGGSRKLGNLTSDNLFRRGDYPERHPGFQRMLENARKVLSEIREIAGTSGLPVYITECDVDFGVSSSVYEDPYAAYRNNEYFAAFQCALAAGMLEISEEFPSNPVAGLIIDTFFFPGRRVFEGQRTLFTAGDIDKPIFNSLRMLGEMGTEKIRFESPEGTNIGGFASRNAKEEVQVLVYNFREETDYSESHEVDLRIAAPGHEAYLISHYRIDRGHSNAYSVWKSLGSPVLPDEEQFSAIRARQELELLEPPRTLPAREGTVRLSFRLGPHAVSLILLEPAD